MEKKKIDKRIFKKSPEELEQYMQFKRRGSRVESKRVKALIIANLSTRMICIEIVLNIACSTKWLSRHPLKVEVMGSSPIQVTR